MLLTLIINTNYLPFCLPPLLYAPEIAAAPDIAQPLRVKLQIVKPYASPEVCSAV